MDSHDRVGRPPFGLPSNIERHYPALAGRRGAVHRVPILDRKLIVNLSSITLAKTLRQVKSDDDSIIGCARIHGLTTAASYTICCAPAVEQLLAMEASVKDIGADEVVKAPPSSVRDDTRVRMGTMSPNFPAVRATPENVADKGQIQMGTMSPSFPR